MGTTIIGDRNQFAIEYELLDPQPPFGRVRLWVNGKWFGAIQREMYLYHMAKMLKWMTLREPCGMRLVYVESADVPTDDELLAGVSWSWGDSFDDFLFVLYAVEAEKLVHVLWKLEESRTGDFPGYELGPHHARVPYTIFDSVVQQYLDAIRIP
jgi:hypothetical protein